jgi:beta-galactosidase/beta-glucuronidase
MPKLLSLVLLILLIVPQVSYSQQSPALQTRWAKQVNQQAPLNEYPRPQLVRNNWINLNGTWDFAITNQNEAKPSKWTEKILVPFSIESQLSGVAKSFLPDQVLWYHRVFKAPKRKQGKKLLLHFDAVDQSCTIWLNRKEIGSHTGGYDGFTFDITDNIINSENELIVKVQDPTNTGEAPHGKQRLKSGGTQYNAVSGVWQTVWLEQVPDQYIENLHFTPDIDKKQINITVYSKTNAVIHFNIAGKTIKGKTNQPCVFSFEDQIKLWSPENPYLYDFTVKLDKDKVKSYFGMRKISIQKDQDGIEKIFLNNKLYFNLGLLDQGYWPDGLYTAPTDEALEYDIKMAKAMGFNTIRKHVKIEPARWYYHCDKLGVLVWQDMPCWRDKILTENGKKLFESAMKIHVRDLYNHPSIIMWCIFNEEWGSFDQERLGKEVALLDTTRIINTHTGSFKKNWAGSMVTDVHEYPGPAMPSKEENKAMVCGEFGGIYQGTPGHEWIPGKGWGHKGPAGISLFDMYKKQLHELAEMKTKGLSAAIYTQPYDLETEENGLYTYDREIFKIPVDTLKSINSELINDN